MLQSRNVTELFNAEKKAQEIIEEARKLKLKRLKEAQNDARSEIERFKKERDEHYRTLEKQSMGNRDEMAEKSKKDTEIQIEQLQSQYDTNKNEILERIMTLVCDINPEAHINARIE